MPTIIPRDDADSQRLARLMLDAAGDMPERVQTVTVGPRMAFVVDDDIAAEVGTGDHVPKPVARKARGKAATAQ